MIRASPFCVVRVSGFATVKSEMIQNEKKKWEWRAINNTIFGSYKAVKLPIFQSEATISPWRMLKR